MSTRTDRSTSKRGRGAYAVGDGRGRKRGGWLWWLLGLLALAALALLLISLLGGDDEKQASAPGAGAKNTLTAEGRALRGNAPDTLKGAIGQQATGSANKVLSVASGTGFWVGASNSDRTFVEYGSAVGGNENQTYKPKVGDVVDLRGEVRPAPADPQQTLKLDATDAEQLKAQGAYVNATRVTAR